MTESKKKEKAKCVYVPPKAEMYAAMPSCLMTTSFWGQGGEGEGQYSDHDHNSGHNGGIEYGAKAVILGQEFSFSDMWEE